MATETTIPVIKKERTKKNGSRKLLSLLILFFLTVLFILFFRSSLSKISTVEITGASMVDAAEIGQAAKIAPGDQFFGFRAGSVEQRVRKVKGVQSANLSKYFPGKVRITIREFPRVAFQIGADGTKQAVLGDGTAIPVKDPGLPFDKPVLSGWSDENPQKSALCKALSQIPPALLSDVSEIKPDPSASFEDKIKLYTRSQFQVVTRIAFLAEKIPYLGYLVNESKDKIGSTGIITLMDQTRVEPFPKDNKTQSESKDTGKR